MCLMWITCVPTYKLKSWKKEVFSREEHIIKSTIDESISLGQYMSRLLALPDSQHLKGPIPGDVYLL